MNEKIQKVLANIGLGSRREIENWLRDERIVVNGHKAKLGDRITLQDKIQVDGRIIKLSLHTKKTRVLLYHKPAGEICTRADPEKRPTIFEHLPLLRNGRWISIGRLDFNTTGLLLLTNDGALANDLMHPSSLMEREYAVRVQGKVTDAMLSKLKKGITLEDGYAKFHKITDQGGEGTNHWYHVIVKEGRNRLVRRLWESQGVMVSRLIRIRFGDIVLPRSVKQGRWLELSEEDVSALLFTLKKQKNQDEI